MEQLRKLRLVDDEGNPTQRNVLIEDGVLKGYMQDSLNARLIGVAATGNGRAFKRVRIVVRAGATPVIVYRRDISDRGWPMDPGVLASLKRGQYASNPGAFGGGMTTARGGTQ